MASSNGSNNGRNPPDDGRYTVDIRVLLGVIMVSMATSFFIGVSLGPTATQQILQASLAASGAGAAGGAAPTLPVVTSVDFGTPLEKPAGTEIHEPAGQHLLVDIKGIEADFLDSETRLSHAMVETIKQSGLTLLSYHCHKLIPKGVSCVGVLLESHISFHTWPDEGVITLDLFTCGNKPLIPAVAILKQLFGIPRAPDSIHMQWSHELRGFRNKKRQQGSGGGEMGLSQSNYAVLDHNSDLSQMIWSPMDVLVKEQVLSQLTKYQRVDIWDMVGLEETPSHEDAIKAGLEPGDERWMTAEVVSPTRHFFLDGVMQSESTSHIQYHEALVHPGMFSHPNPQRVAIVGGGEGATLREVLKHSTVQSVTMVEIDEELVQIVKEHMPYLSDCTNLVGRANDCFADPISRLIIQDGKEYFQQQNDQGISNQFDVVIMDALEPELESPIAQGLYEMKTLDNIFQSLTDEGILIIQIGRAPTLLDPRPDIGYNAPREQLFQKMESLPDVQAMFVYEDAHSGFNEPRAFMVVCKSSSCRARFYATADEMDYLIYDRIVRTNSKARALSYFDGVTHLGYQVAPKAWETIYCRREPTPFECSYRFLDFKAPLMEYNMDDESKGAFLVTADYAAGEEDSKSTPQTHVWANVDIPKGAYIMAEHLASSLQLSYQSIENLQQNMQYGGVTVIGDFVDFVKEYGHDSQSKGSARRLVEIGASYFIQAVDSESDANVGRWIPPHPQGIRPKYSPVYERHRLSFDVFMVATKDIPKGTELKRYSLMWESP